MKPSADGFVPSRPVNPDSGEPLKRLEDIRAGLHRAEAAVLMRIGVHGPRAGDLLQAVGVPGGQHGPGRG